MLCPSPSCLSSLLVCLILFLTMAHTHPIPPSLTMKFVSSSQRFQIGSLLAPTCLHLAPDQANSPCYPTQFFLSSVAYLLCLSGVPGGLESTGLQSTIMTQLTNSGSWEPAGPPSSQQSDSQRPVLLTLPVSLPSPQPATRGTLALRGKADEEVCRGEPQNLPCSLSMLPQLLLCQSQGQKISGMTMAPLACSVLSLGPQRPGRV